MIKFVLGSFLCASNQPKSSFDVFVELLTHGAQMWVKFVFLLQDNKILLIDQYLHSLMHLTNAK